MELIIVYTRTVWTGSEFVSPLGIKVFSTGIALPLIIVTGVSAEATVTGLKPETSYEVRLYAVNGKGEGESSLPKFFKTEPFRKFLSLQHTVEP